MNKLRLSLLALAAAFAVDASAAQFKLGGHVGALGTTGIGSSSNIGYGVHFGVNPYGFAAFQIDATFAPLTGGTYFSSSPAIILYLVDHEELKFGLLGGAGFYKFPGADMKFGLNTGASGEFALAENFTVGMETRYHPVFSSEDVWSVFVTLGFRFEPGDGW